MLHWSLYVGAAAALVAGSMWLMHAIDEGRYQRLQAQVAQAHVIQLTRIAQERDAFALRLKTAEQIAAEEKTLREQEAAKYAADLQEALNQASKNDANFGRCLLVRLPPDVVRLLPN